MVTDHHYRQQHNFVPSNIHIVPSKLHFVSSKYTFKNDTNYKLSLHLTGYTTCRRNTLKFPLKGLDRIITGSQLSRSISLYMPTMLVFMLTVAMLFLNRIGGKSLFVVFFKGIIFSLLYSIVVVSKGI